MAFYLLFFCGVLGGVLGGMGMGGGTALIPLLSLLCGVEQGVAQGVNLLSFWPMALAALAVHARQGLVDWREGLRVGLPALASSALFSLAAGRLPSVILKISFGSFLIFLSIFRLKRAFSAKNAPPRA